MQLQQRPLRQLWNRHMKGCLSRVEAALQHTHAMLRALLALCTDQRDSSELWTELAGDAAHSQRYQVSVAIGHTCEPRNEPTMEAVTIRKPCRVVLGHGMCNECRAHKVAGYEGAATTSRIQAHVQGQQAIRVLHLCEQPLHLQCNTCSSALVRSLHSWLDPPDTCMTQPETHAGLQAPGC